MSLSWDRGDEIPDESPQKPLRGGRRRSDQIITHRLEIGVWERERLKMYEQTVLWTTLAPIGLGVVGVSAAAGLCAWTLYLWGKEVTGFVDDAVGKFGAVAKVGLKFTPFGPFVGLFDTKK